jgi:hypothetical protein
LETVASQDVMVTSTVADSVTVLADATAMMLAATATEVRILAVVGCWFGITGKSRAERAKWLNYLMNVVEAGRERADDRSQEAFLDTEDRCLSIAEREKVSGFGQPVILVLVRC